jgi:tRNA-specific 2-thiouridylase
MKLIAGLSGGVDSAVATYLALKDGHEILGIHLNFSKNDKKNFCATSEDALDAKKVAIKLGIPFDMWDYSDDFYKYVEKYFIKQYKNGKTPNPCIRCNQTIKFGKLLKDAKKLGFDGILTGHWSTISNDGIITRGINKHKEQSYVLAGVGQNISKHIVTPLGKYKTKNEIREIAFKQNLIIARKRESYDICFVDNLNKYLTKNIGIKKGYFIDSISGQKIKEHNGSFHYTIGQAKKLDLQNYDGSGNKKYINKITGKTVYVGERNTLKINKFKIKNFIKYSSFFSHSLHSIDNLKKQKCEKCVKDKKYKECKNMSVQIRAHGNAHKCFYDPISTTTGIITLKDDYIYGVSKGQSAVLYANNNVIAHGIIA